MIFQTGSYEYHSTWFNLIRSREIPSNRPKIESRSEREMRMKELESQFQELQDQGPIPVVLGKPKQVFSVTNETGEAYQGFLELVGPGEE
jgi:hypothetical protein